MSEIHVVAILTPAAGKGDRLKELLTTLATEVKSKEPDVKLKSKYEMFEQVNGEGVNVIFIQECYKDQVTFDAHFKTPWFGDMERTIPEENLLAAPLDLKTVKPFAGFASRL
ncbi:hypothetical protein D0Z07_7079 [Hyphodiscus hymeniophilus]|uniref:ABM domain-containing protein n=1 Tax=Hyphodiscus hymeniophilus TaxID=353542 RepID=A0A9P7AV60_9HELO|nr:hypothetical protein D0Z07_7079 [Hyphodiscus hymeniophilus]